MSQQLRKDIGFEFAKSSSEFLSEDVLIELSGTKKGPQRTLCKSQILVRCLLLDRGNAAAFLLEFAT